MSNHIDLTNDIGYAIDPKADWGMTLNLSGVTVCTAVVMTIREGESTTTPLIASFISGGGGTLGTVSISSLALTFQITGSNSAAITYEGIAYYDIFATCDGGLVHKIMHGFIDIN